MINGGALKYVVVISDIVVVTVHIYCTGVSYTSFGDGL